MAETKAPWWPSDAEASNMRAIRYEVAIQRCAYIGAGYGGVFLLAGLGGEHLFDEWWWVEPVLASVIALGILMLAWAYLRFTWSLRDLRLEIAGSPDANAARYPRFAHWMYVCSMVPLIVAAAIVLACTWVTASSQAVPPAQPTQPPSSTP